MSLIFWTWIIRASALQRNLPFHEKNRIDLADSFFFLEGFCHAEHRAASYGDSCFILQVSVHRGGHWADLTGHVSKYGRVDEVKASEVKV